jgi:hypothetical protein
MLNDEYQAIKALEAHREDEMLAGLGALCVERDEEEEKTRQDLVLV